MGGVLEFFAWNVYLSPHSLSSFSANYNNQVSLIFKVSAKINFGPELHSFFLVSGLRDKRKRYCWHCFHSSKLSIFVSNGFIWWEEFNLDYFLGFFGSEIS